MDLARPCRQRSSIARSVIVVSPRRTELNGAGRCENALISRRRSHVSTASCREPPPMDLDVCLPYVVCHLIQRLKKGNYQAN